LGQVSWKLYIEEALAHEFDLRGIAYDRQKSFQVPYKTKTAGLYRPDFVVAGKVIVDAKAIAKLSSLEEALAPQLSQSDQVACRAGHQFR